MRDISTLADSCLQGFEKLGLLLDEPNGKYRAEMPVSKIQDHFDKFRIWCGNLGALQKGYASLDYRLRDSAFMHTAVREFIEQLDKDLAESMAVISGHRPPFEDQPRPLDMSDEESTDDSSKEDEPRPRKELPMRLSNIGDLLNKLYRLGYKIRDSNLRPASKKALSLEQRDKETGAELFEQIKEFDEKHVHELLGRWRQHRKVPSGHSDYLSQRLTAAVTIRRKYFKYWERHAKKLAGGTTTDTGAAPTPGRGEPQGQVPAQTTPVQQPTNKGAQGPGPEGQRPHTLLSKTDATPYDAALDEQTEKGTVFSVASTALDAEGKGVELPKPPAEARRAQGFTCPYCFVLCPAKQGSAKAWRAHVLYDLQPYVCTYGGCRQDTELYRSRRQWLDHEELVHRRSWRCNVHREHVSESPDGLRRHLSERHPKTLTDQQIEDLVNACCRTAEDERDFCPVCFQAGPFDNGLSNHLASHMEKIALFSLPRSFDEEESSETGSDAARGPHLGSRDSFDSDGPLQFSDEGGQDDSGSEHSVFPEEAYQGIPVDAVDELQDSEAQSDTAAESEIRHWSEAIFSERPASQFRFGTTAASLGLAEHVEMERWSRLSERLPPRGENNYTTVDWPLNSGRFEGDSVDSSMELIIITGTAHHPQLVLICCEPQGEEYGTAVEIRELVLGSPVSYLWLGLKDRGRLVNLRFATYEELCLAYLSLVALKYEDMPIPMDVLAHDLVGSAPGGFSWSPSLGEQSVFGADYESNAATLAVYVREGTRVARLEASMPITMDLLRPLWTVFVSLPSSGSAPWLIPVSETSICITNARVYNFMPPIDGFPRQEDGSIYLDFRRADDATSFSRIWNVSPYQTWNQST